MTKTATKAPNSIFSAL